MTLKFEQNPKTFQNYGTRWHEKTRQGTRRHDKALEDTRKAREGTGMGHEGTECFLLYQFKATDALSIGEGQRPDCYYNTV